MADTTELLRPVMMIIPDAREGVAESGADWRDVHRTLSGDEAACARLFGRYEAEVGRQMQRFSRDGGVCEELAHEVFVEVYLSLGRYRPAGVPFGHWVARIATRVGYRYWKQEGRRREVSLEGVDAAAPAEASDAGAAELLHSLLARLSAADRLVLMLMYFEDCSVQEIADRTGWNQAMVKMRVYRARRKLKAIIERRGLLEQLQGMTNGNT